MAVTATGGTDVVSTLVFNAGLENATGGSPLAATGEAETTVGVAGVMGGLAEGTVGEAGTPGGADAVGFVKAPAPSFEDVLGRDSEGVMCHVAEGTALLVATSDVTIGVACGGPEALMGGATRVSLEVMGVKGAAAAAAA